MDEIKDENELKAFNKINIDGIDELYDIDNG